MTAVQTLTLTFADGTVQTFIPEQLGFTATASTESPLREPEAEPTKPEPDPTTDPETSPERQKPKGKRSADKQPRARATKKNRNAAALARIVAAGGKQISVGSYPDKGTVLTRDERVRRLRNRQSSLSTYARSHGVALKTKVRETASGVTFYAKAI